jgi:hypothetical protein
MTNDINEDEKEKQHVVSIQFISDKFIVVGTTNGYV